MQTITITKKAALGIGFGFIAMVAIVAAGSVAWASHQFSDVPDDHHFHDSIGYVASAGIAEGFGDGTFRPSQDATRGQVAAFIHRASGNAPGIAPSVTAAKLGNKTAAEWQALVDAQQDAIDALEDKLQFVSIVDTNTMRISGANLQIVSGSGWTDGWNGSARTVNGLGNLIVGYNETFEDTRTGSHNLVVGPNHSYSSYGGFVAGSDNTISGAHASVTGGRFNTASGLYASVTGGTNNTASGNYSTVSGGFAGSVTGADDWRAGDLFQDS